MVWHYHTSASSHTFIRYLNLKNLKFKIWSTFTDSLKNCSRPIASTCNNWDGRWGSVLDSWLNREISVVWSGVSPSSSVLKSPQVLSLLLVSLSVYFSAYLRFNYDITEYFNAQISLLPWQSYSLALHLQPWNMKEKSHNRYQCDWPVKKRKVWKHWRMRRVVKDWPDYLGYWHGRSKLLLKNCNIFLSIMCSVELYIYV